MTCQARWFYPDIRWIRAGVVPIVVLIACCLDRGYQTDFWHHLARGRAIVSTGNVVNVDLFTCSLGGSENPRRQLALAGSFSLICIDGAA